MKIRGKRQSLAGYSKRQIQKAYDEALSRPKYLIIDHLEESFPRPISRSALVAKCSKRIKVLALPRLNFAANNLTKSLDNQAALKAKPTEWNNLASVPLFRTVYVTKRHHFHHLPTRQRGAVLENMKRIRDLFRTAYPPHGQQSEYLRQGSKVHVKCLPPPEDDGKYICRLDQKEKKEFLIRMIQMAQRKDIPKPPKAKRGPKKPLKEFLTSMKRLATTKSAPDVQTPIDPYKVKRQAMHYVASEHINELSKHRPPPPIPPMFDFRGNELPPRREWDLLSRQKVVASERTIELAVPKRVKPKAVEAVKVDPFAVSKAALTAVCSERITELAEPRKRK